MKKKLKGRRDSRARRTHIHRRRREHAGLSTGFSFLPVHTRVLRVKPSMGVGVCKQNSSAMN